MGLLSEKETAHVMRCVADIDGSANGGSRGSGFFIDADLLLTCEHVAGSGAEPVAIRVAGATEPVEGSVIASSPRDDGDLALVRLRTDGGPVDPEVPRREPQPAVLLGGWPDHIDVAVAPGFPTYTNASNVVVAGQFRVVDLKVEPVLDLASGAVVVASLAGDVARGQSGSALVSYPDLRVVGIVQYRAPGATGLTGGGAIPMSFAATRFPEVAALLQQPPAAAFGWRSLLANEPDLVQRQRIELEFAGDACKWGVGEISTQPQPDVTIDAFGDTVGRAVFGWLSGRRPRTADELRWSGELLGIALLAGSAGRRVTDQHAYGSPFDLRIAFNDTTELQNAPWELALIRDTMEGLATRASTTFTRIDPAATEPTELQAVEKLRVLALGRHPLKGEREAIPIEERLERIEFERRRPKLDYMATVSLQLEDGTVPTIVHYAGYARRAGTGNDGGLLVRSSDPDRFLQLASVAASCVRAGVRVLIVQSRAPRERLEWGPPPPPSDYDGLLKGSLQAIVFTQFGVSDFVLRLFNVAFYKELDRGSSIEDAVQFARAAVKEFSDDNEPSGFGAFVVVTPPAGGPVLLGDQVRPVEVAPRQVAAMSYVPQHQQAASVKQ